MFWFSSMISSFARMVGFSLFCLLIDYGVYFAVDVLYARRQLATSKLTTGDQNAIWRKLCGLLLAAALPIHAVHHCPLVLYLLTCVTFLLTLRQPFERVWTEATATAPFLVTVADAFQRYFGILINHAINCLHAFLLALFGDSKQQPTTANNNHHQTSLLTASRSSYYTSAFHRFVPPPTSTTSSMLASTQHPQQAISVLPRGGGLYNGDDYYSEHEEPSAILRDRQPFSKDYCSQLQQQQAVEEDDSVLSNGSLLHPPRRSFLKTSTPVDPATGARASSCYPRA